MESAIIGVVGGVRGGRGHGGLVERGTELTRRRTTRRNTRCKEASRHQEVSEGKGGIVATTIVTATIYLIFLCTRGEDCRDCGMLGADRRRSIISARCISVSKSVLECDPSKMSIISGDVGAV